MRMSIAGATRLAVVHAAAYAQLGHDVALVTADERVRAALRSGTAPYHEPGLATLIAEHATSGRIRVIDDPAERVSCTIHLVCADVPITPGADLGPLSGTVTTLIPRLAPGCLVVGTGLAPAGTAQWLADWVSEAAGVELAWLPLIAPPGHLIDGALQRNHLVYGLPPGRPVEGMVATLDQLHAPLLDRASATRRLVPYQAAELMPLVAAGRRALDATYADFLSELADAVGIDVADLLAASTPQPQPPSLGFGADDARGLALLATSTDRLGLEHRGELMRACERLNNDRPWVAATLLSAIGGERELQRVAILGAGAIADSDDLAASPSLALAAILQRSGKSVTVSDPVAAARDITDIVEVAFVRDPYHAVDKADAVVVATPWGEYRALDPVRLAGLVRRRSILDAAGVLRASEWRQSGWTFRAFGR